MTVEQSRHWKSRITRTPLFVGLSAFRRAGGSSAFASPKATRLSRGATELPVAASPRITAEPTAGDFGHTRRRSVQLACCCCTSCCFTLLGGGVGLLIGAVKGIMHGVSSSGNDAENVWLAMLLTTLQFLAYFLGYALAGLLLGAACGGMIDVFWFGLLQ